MNTLDQKFIEGLKSGNSTITADFFQKEIAFTLYSIRRDVFKNEVDYDDLVSELYIYLSSNGWHKLDTFASLNSCRLKTWMSSVAWRFFLKNYKRIMFSQFDTPTPDTIEHGFEELKSDVMLDIKTTLEGITNPKYVDAIKLLILEDRDPKEVAELWETSVQNVYLIKSRAVKEFILVFADR